ncbi:hypothetical protein [Paenibacillus xylanexedens]|uniref:hypothetical protein n=1 Tax=Paenibacillus xylanexedens TaxID=528191 RepID=UPI000F51FD69|nr:hypothetical protein [Paenibacillus xylanexedens]
MKQTPEELAAVKRYVELPYLLSSIEHDKKQIANSEMKMYTVYINHLDNIQSKVTAEAYKLKNYLRENDIRIIETSKSSESLKVEYSIRGYTQRMVLLWSKVKVDITLILSDYLKVDITELK